MQETWLPYSDQHSMNNIHEDYSFQVASSDMFEHAEDKISSPAHVWHGVAIGWRRDTSFIIQPLQSAHERIAGIKVNLAKNSLILLSLYAPTSGQDENFLETISYLAEFVRVNCSQGDKIIIGADTNCSTKSSFRRKLAWENFCKENNLVTYSPPLPSFHHHNGLSNSFIDMFVATDSLILGDTTQQCTLNTPLNLSSHDPIFNTVVVSSDQGGQNHGFSKTYTDFNRNRVIWDSDKLSKYQQLADQALSEAVKFWKNPESIPLLSTLMSNLLVKCASMVFKTSSSKNQKLPKRVPKDIRQAQATLKKCWNIWKNAGKPGCTASAARQDYRDARANLQRLSRHKNNLHNIKQNNHLMHLNHTNKSKIFAVLKKVRGDYSTNMTSVLHTPVGTFSGQDVLEGFASDTEYLGKSNEGNEYFDQKFYKLCKLDNLYIFEISSQNPVKIPPMSMAQLNNILNGRMKLGKACDIYQLTVEHLRYCGDKAKGHILVFINRILQNIYFLSCQQLKVGLGTPIYKQKNKPVSLSSSYRRVTVTPILGAIIDYYLDPIAESIFRPAQSPDQLGFTAGVSYLLAAVQRGECQRWAVDRKLTCFGVSLDGESAFPSVERSIQVRELYSNGERGDILNYSKHTYENTDCHIKLKDKISRKIKEHKGNRQGHIRASGHFKVYINSSLLSLKNSKLGFQMGNLTIPVVCVADDAYLLAGTPSGLQAVLDIMEHYAKKYQLRFNASKTKIVVTGSKLDMAYFKETAQWTLNGETISVVDNNEHLGLVVAGLEEEQKNVDQNILKCRKSLFALLGPVFAYKCLLSPLLQLHLWRTCSYPSLLSGLAALPIRPANMKSLEIFQRKILRGMLKLSQTSPIPALHFLLGELPVEGMLHVRTLGIFHNIWSNPDCTVHTMLLYILKTCDSNSTTWANHIKIICQKYDLPSPLYLLQEPAWPKQVWNSWVKTKIITWHEKSLRNKAKNNSKMKYLNVQLHGLSGRPHPALLRILSTQDSKKLRLHLKFLTSDYITNEQLSLTKPNTSSACSLCTTTSDSTEHVLVACQATSHVRSRLFPELMNTVFQVQPNSRILAHDIPNDILSQFILDCTSFNLPDSIRIPVHNPDISKIYRISRDWCFAIHSERCRLLRQAGQNN